MSELKLCCSCGNKGLLINDGEDVVCINIKCHFWNEFIPYSTWQSRPIEDQLKAENERLRFALDDISSYVDDESKIGRIITQALNEVTNSKTDYKEHLKNMSESERRRLHENRWENDENEVTK